MAEIDTTINPPDKQCTKCLKLSPATTEFFHKCARLKYGVASVCKTCVNTGKKIRRPKYKAVTSSYNKKHYQKHQEKMKARTRKYYQDNHGQELAKANARHRANPQAVKIRNATYYETHREQEIQRSIQYQKEHPQQTADTHHRARARKRGAGICDFTDAQWELIKAHYKYRCYYCKPTCWRCQKKRHTLTRDHIIPVSKGGDHTLSNIVPACHACNCKKHAGQPPIPVQPLLL